MLLCAQPNLPWTVVDKQIPVLECEFLSYLGTSMFNSPQQHNKSTTEDQNPGNYVRSIFLAGIVLVTKI
jgi:hypothetical protein